MQETKNPKQRVTVGAQLHKSEADACPDANVATNDEAQWHIALVPQRKYMLMCRDYFRSLHLDTYIAGTEEEKTYKNRTRRTIQHIVIYGMVFVKMDSSKAESVFRGCPYMSTFLYNRAKPKDEKTGRPPLATVSDKEMNDLKQAINESMPGAVTFSDERLENAESIYVARGPLKGLEGSYLHRDGDDYLILYLSSIGHVKIKVMLKDCVIRDKKKS